MSDFLNTLTDFWNHAAIRSVVRVAIAILIFTFGFRLARFFARKLSGSRGIRNMGETASEFLGNLIRCILYVIVVCTALSVVGVSATVFASVISAAGIAIGLALQGGLSNLAGGFIIVMFRPFDVGDFISVGSTSGTVTDIGIFYTTLSTPDKLRIVVPNGTITGSEVTDYSVHTTRRMDVPFAVSYRADSDAVRRTLLETAAADPLILKDPSPEAFMSAHTNGVIEWTLRLWTSSDDYWTVNHTIYEDVKRAFDRDGIEIALPQLDVHINPTPEKSS